MDGFKPPWWHCTLDEKTRQQLRLAQDECEAEGSLTSPCSLCNSKCPGYLMLTYYE